MSVSIKYINEVKRCYSLTSDNQIAKKIGVTRQWVSQVRNYDKKIGPDTVISIGKLLNINPSAIDAELNAEKSKLDENKIIWKEIAQRLTSTSLCLALTFPLSLNVVNDAGTALQCILC